MKTLFFLGVLAVILAVFAALASKRGKGVSLAGAISKRNALTKREQAMYFRLSGALANHIVLAQVAFSALLKTKAQKDRNRFDRKVADFVVFNKAFEVIAIIELDDDSHKGREIQDAERQALLTRAGYKVIRYNNVPDLQTLHRDFKINPAQIFETAASAQTST
ncbi:DUF2726 domain-containing protein [Herbaspirillum huttiense]|uniref:DUF2726 domain-containing protein n=1 Tax=Herbaspirillum huttiense TaxID=863372 RepID=UPI0031E3A3D2